MTRAITRWGPYFAAACVFLALGLFVMAGAYTYRQQNSVNRKLCAQTVENRMGIRTTWQAARDIVLHQQSDREAIIRTNMFFNEILKVIPPLECVDDKPSVVKEG